MKTLNVIYACFDNLLSFENIFASQSAFERVINFSRELNFIESSVVFTNKLCQEKINAILKKMNLDIQKVILEAENEKSVLELICKYSNQTSSDDILLTFADCPFYDYQLTNELYDLHNKYKAEYTFADGYPEGFVPVLLNSGTASILLHKNFYEIENNDVQNKFDSQSVFDLIKKDINAYEIESLVSSKDYRLERLNFSASNKRNTIACKNLFNYALENKINFTAEALADEAIKSPSIMKTVPAYYNIQLCQNVDGALVYSPYVNEFEKKYGVKPFSESNSENKTMSLESFKSLLKQISDFSGDAVLNLGFMCEPLLINNFSSYIKVALEYKNISLVIETCATKINDEFINEVQALLTETKRIDASSRNYSAINWIVLLDAVTEKTYLALHPDSNFEEAKKGLSLLCNKFPGSVYPQFTRCTINEDELELFWKLYHNENSESHGKLVVQKYDSYCKKLEDLKVCDLSPVERNVCWHLKRDMNILFNGDILFCKEVIFDKIIGNAFADGLENVWHKTDEEIQNHLQNRYCKFCENCDEYYTFNF